VELAGINSLFLDTAPVIYYIEAHPQYGPLMKDIVDSFKSGALEAIPQSLPSLKSSRNRFHKIRHT
jgi:hypothetical protein